MNQYISVCMCDGKITITIITVAVPCSKCPYSCFDIGCGWSTNKMIWRISRLLLGCCWITSQFTGWQCSINVEYQTHYLPCHLLYMMLHLWQFIILHSIWQWIDVNGMEMKMKLKARPASPLHTPIHSDQTKIEPNRIKTRFRIMALERW